MDNINTFAQYYNNPVVLLEGGQYGHMTHIWEDYDLTFQDIKVMINDLFQGEIKAVKEKVDGQALAVSVNDDGEVIFARNKGHVKDFGAKALNWKGIADQFADRGDLTDAFAFAAKDLCEALSRLPKDIRQARFGIHDARVPAIGKSGTDVVKVKKWLNFEIIWPETTNVIPYNHRLIILHNFNAVDVNGVKRESDFNDFAKQVQNDLQQINQLVQKKFTISTVPLLSIPKPKDFSLFISQVRSKLDQLIMSANLTDQNTLGEYYSAIMTDKIYKTASNIAYPITRDISNMLVRRWLYNEKRPNIRDLIKSIPDNPETMEVTSRFKEWIKSVEKTDMKKSMVANIIQPVKDIIIDVGVEVMINMSEFLALDASGASRNMREAIMQIAKQVEASNDADLTKQLDKYMNSIMSRGGLDKVAPTEGITFSYNNSVYKLTGTFTDINQIVGFFKYNRGRELSSRAQREVDKNI